MSAFDPVAAVDRILEVYSGDMSLIFRDPERLAASRAITDPYFDPEVVTVLPTAQATLGFPSGELRGVETLTAVWAEWLEAFGKLTQVNHPARALADGRVIARTDTTVELSTGGTFSTEGGSVWEFENEKIVRVTFAPTLAALAELTGVEERAP
jgi:ketosteroid isomerase-like protein